MVDVALMYYVVRATAVFHRLCVVWVGPLVVQELKRIVESSEITKCVGYIV